MINFKEYPRGGGNNGNVENSGELHLPCVVLVDTSGSMNCVKDQVARGLALLGDSLKEDEMAQGRVEFCIIAFDDTARIMTPFGPAYDYQAPELDYGGMTAMHAAVDLALGEIEARKDQYRANGTPWHRPWIYMLTDGGANDNDNGAFERLRQAQEDKHCLFMPVAIGEDADIDLLKSLNIQGYTLKADKNDFVGSFKFLSSSLSQASVSKPGDTVKLPLDRTQIEIVM